MKKKIIPKFEAFSGLCAKSCFNATKTIFAGGANDDNNFNHFKLKSSKLFFFSHDV